jgi:hypothetical protein
VSTAGVPSESLLSNASDKELEETYRKNGSEFGKIIDNNND